MPCAFKFTQVWILCVWRFELVSLFTYTAISSTIYCCPNRFGSYCHRKNGTQRVSYINEKHSGNNRWFVGRWKKMATKDSIQRLHTRIPYISHHTVTFPAVNSFTPFCILGKIFFICLFVCNVELVLSSGCIAVVTN